MTRRPILACIAGLLLAGVATQAAGFKCMPIYGNWCGIDYPTSGWPT